MIYDNWEWPQWFFAALYAINLLLQSYLHGQPRTGKFSAPTIIISTALSVWILYMGGFWS